MVDWLINLDRRWIFLLMALAVGIPTLFQASFPESPSPIVRDAFEVIQNLPPDSKVLISLDFDPASQGELGPMAAAFTRHLCEKKHRIYYVTLWPLGPPIIEQNLSLIRREYPDRKYGTDQVNLGFKSGYEGVIKAATANMRELFLTDHAGTSLSQLPMTKDMKTIREMDLIISVSAGYPGLKEWVQYAGTPYDIKVIGGSTGVQSPQLYPYIPRQLQGLLPAIKGAAEYEQALIDAYPDIAKIPSSREGLRRMGPQLVAHVLMIFLIILGNVIFFIQRRRENTR